MELRRWRLLAVGALTGFAAACAPDPLGGPEPPPLPAGVLLNVRERTYPVRGRTVDEITHSLDSSGPTWQGRVVQGLTQWRLRWRWRSTMHEGTCRLMDLRVLAEVEITLPRWRDHDSASASLALDWESFEEALRGHEYRHRNLAVEAATEVLGMLRTLRTRDCIEMMDVAGAQAREVVRKYHSRNDLFERNTRRGRAQGAAWPPGG